MTVRMTVWPIKLYARAYQKKQDCGLDDQADPRARLSVGRWLVIDRVTLSPDRWPSGVWPSVHRTLLGVQLQPPAGAPVQCLA